MTVLKNSPVTMMKKGPITFLISPHLLISVTPTTASLTVTVYLKQLSFCCLCSITHEQLHTMLVLGLITCIVLRALSAQAKVVDSFEECKEFLYQGKEPSGMDQNAKKICQKLGNKRFYYATLYSVNYKIPLYSAYTLDPACSSSHGRTKNWRLEPQVTKS